MRISDIHFREIEASDIETLLSSEYKNQYYRDPVTSELSEIDISDWRETLFRLCKNPQVSLWVQTENIKKKKIPQPNPLTNIFDIDTYLNACNLNDDHKNVSLNEPSDMLGAAGGGGGGEEEKKSERRRGDSSIV